MSALWWIPLVLMAVAAGCAWWGCRRVAREAAALPACAARLGHLRSGLAEVEGRIADARRAVDELDLR